MTIVERTNRVTGGVDTHLDLHVAAVVDQVCGVLGVESFPTTAAGYGRLAAWLASFGPAASVGVEGTGARREIFRRRDEKLRLWRVGPAHARTWRRRLVTCLAGSPRVWSADI